MSWLTHPLTLRICRTAMGVIFIWSALAKLGDLRSFAEQVHNFRMLPIALENLWAVTLPWIELVAGLALVLGLRARAGALVVTALMAIFTIGVAQAMARGLDFECGCFGTSDASTVGLRKLAENLVLLAVAFVGTLPSRR